MVEKIPTLSQLQWSPFLAVSKPFCAIASRYLIKYATSAQKKCWVLWLSSTLKRNGDQVCFHVFIAGVSDAILLGGATSTSCATKERRLIWHLRGLSWILMLRNDPISTNKQMICSCALSVVGFIEKLSSKPSKICNCLYFGRLDDKFDKR